MASPSTQQHGKLGAIYWLRANGFKGSGLNDLTWGSFSSGSDSCHFEVVIDGAGTPDTFKWRENGGGWTTGVAITGASQNLAGANGTQAITFAATTGHTANDQWSRGNLYSEACTESTNTAQITDTALRLINPNATLTWTDTGSEVKQRVDYTRGLAYFSGNVTVVTVSGDNGYILESGLQQLGYLTGWSLNCNVNMADATSQGDKWTDSIPGESNASGTINKMFIANANLLEILLLSAAHTQDYFLLELFNYDPDQDQTGDRFIVWATINQFGVNAPITDIVRSNVSFTVHGAFSFTANS